MKILLLTCPRGDGTAYSHVYSSLSESAIYQVSYYLRNSLGEVNANLLLECAPLPLPDDTEETEYIDYDGKWICSLVWQEINEEL